MEVKRLELKVIVGQLCLTVVVISAMAMGYDSELLFLIAGALATSIGYPFTSK